MGILLRNQGDKGIEIGNRLGDLRVEKALLASSLQGGGSHAHPTALGGDGTGVIEDLVIITRLKRIHHLLRHFGGKVPLLSVGAETQDQSESEEGERFHRRTVTEKRRSIKCSWSER